MMRLTRSKPADTALFECLASRQRRAVVAVLDAADDDLSERDLAARTAARLEGKSPATVSDDEQQRTRVGLHHRDLPKLASVDLVHHDREDGRVALGDHAALEDPGIRETIESRSSEESLDAIFEVLADDRRQRVLSLLREVRRPVSIREAAASVAGHEQADSPEDVPDRVVERVHADLWHTHLPKFREADLVEYDAADDTIVYDGHPELRSNWLDSGVGDCTADA